MRDDIYPDDDCVFQMKASDKRKLAERRLAELTGQGLDLHPVKIPARGKIAKSFWSHEWCRHIESYEDMSYRVDLGRSHARTNSVIDLKVSAGEINALVVDGETYKVQILISPLEDERITELSALCAGQIASVVDLLCGRLSEEVMDTLIKQTDSLFPTPQEIKFRCNCLDYADLCLHAASALYALSVVGDSQPEIFFRLRGVSPNRLIGEVSASMLSSDDSVPGGQDLHNEDLGALFGIELIDEG